MKLFCAIVLVAIFFTACASDTPRPVAPVATIAQTAADSAPIAPPNEDGLKLAAALDAMQVETHWLIGVGVDWKTGEPNNKTVPLDDTHCSAFVAAVSLKFGVYLLRPPEHKTVLLANAQNEWLNFKGAEYGWERVADGARAQELANAGRFVIASYKNPDPAKSGHVAVVRPSDKTIARILEEGPQIIQAGSHNYDSAPLAQGFSGHASAFASNRIQFFAHSIQLP